MATTSRAEKECPSEELNKTLNSKGYQIVKEIGSGGFAKVFLVYNDNYKSEYAAKVFPRENMDKRSLSSFENELNKLRRLTYTHIVYCYDSIIGEKHYIIIMEYCQLGSLSDYIKINGPFNVDTCIFLFKQLLHAINKIHNKGIAHLDIKPQNILIDRYGRLKLSDFGLASNFDGLSLNSKYQGSPLYMAPEVMKQVPYDPSKVDIWSLGATFYYMAKGTLPWNDNNKGSLMDFLFNSFNLLPSALDQQLYLLIRNMIVVNPAKRCRAEDLLKMNIFKENDKFPPGFPFVKEKKEAKIIKPKAGSYIQIRAKSITSLPFAYLRK